MVGQSVDIRSAILALIQEVARDHQKKLAPLTDDLPLLESGLDSHCIAVIVICLEDLLGFDPFDTEAGGKFPVTLGNFITYYKDAAINSVT
jgi:acyl carrier protein